MIEAVFRPLANWLPIGAPVGTKNPIRSSGNHLTKTQRIDWLTDCLVPTVLCLLVNKLKD
jgi:hypothetical protein